LRLLILLPPFFIPLPPLFIRLSPLFMMRSFAPLFCSGLSVAASLTHAVPLVHRSIAAPLAPCARRRAHAPAPAGAHARVRPRTLRRTRAT
jgi:hypothetical protein